MNTVTWSQLAMIFSVFKSTYKRYSNAGKLKPVPVTGPYGSTGQHRREESSTSITFNVPFSSSYYEKLW
jgi:hypothetical protein